MEKAYPALQAEAQELLALSQFLAHIELAFGVRQKALTAVDAAVAATLELETYLRPKTVVMPIAQVEESSEDDVIAATVCSERGGAQDPFGTLLERMDKLIDAKLSAALGATVREPNNWSQPRGRWSRSSRTVTCWNCREEGHIARSCPTKYQGNGRPSEQ